MFRPERWLESTETPKNMHRLFSFWTWSKNLCWKGIYCKFILLTAEHFVDVDGKVDSNSIQELSL